MRFITLLLVGFLAVPLSAKNPVALAEDLAKSITRIHAAGPYRNWNSCTAFSVNEERSWGMTAEHCVITAGGFVMDIVDDQYRELTLVANSTALGFGNDDLALIGGEIFKELNQLTSMTIVPPAGGTISALGYALGQTPPTFYHGIVARSSNEVFMMFLQGAALSGMSGAPVVNSDMQVIGLITETSVADIKVTGTKHFKELQEAALWHEENDEEQP
jgi:hypothetical protein